MKTCSYCGREYPDEAVVCAVDQTPLEQAKPKAALTGDEEYLRLLAIFHYVVAGMAALFSLFPVFHLLFGLFMILGQSRFPSNGGPPIAFMGLFFVVFALTFIALGLTFAAFVFVTGRFLAHRKHYTFCLVMAAVECIFMPFGTVLGVFTIITLVRDTVKRLFGTSPPAAPSPPGT